MSATFSVKNFEKFQHYKDRRPPWIKLYSELLDDYEFGLMPDASKAHLIAIWLLASRYDNAIPYDIAWVTKRINATSKVDLDLLARHGFIVVDEACSNALASRKQSAMPETETQVESETEYSRARGEIQADYNRKVREYLDTVGKHATASPASLDISPLTALESRGYDWSSIMMVIRGVVPRLKRPVRPSYFVPIVIEHFSIPEKPKPEKVEPTEWINTDDPRWPKVSKGRKPMPTKEHPGEKGLHIPVSELRGLMPDIPKSLQRIPTPA